MSDTDVAPVPRHRLKLSLEQQVSHDAILAFAADPHKLALCIFGLAGAGKTFLLAELLSHKRFAAAALCGPTGKSAAVLHQKTGQAAKTIHNFLYDPPEVKKDEKGRKELLWTSRYEEDSMSNRFVFLDECAQVGDRLMQDLLATGVIVIGFGDDGQVRPVKQNPFFTTCDYRLTEIHRQALDSPIIRQAHQVRQGGSYETDGDAFRVVRRAYDQDLVGADILLCWTNKRRFNLNAQARALRGITAQMPQVGEPLLCLRNYRWGGVYRGGVYALAEPFFDGDTSITVDVNGVSRTIRNIKFDITEQSRDDNSLNTSFNFGYSCTVHSAAGSEWDNVLLFDDYRLDDEDERKRWQYTAITRAAQRITVVR